MSDLTPANVPPNVPPASPPAAGGRRWPLVAAVAVLVVAILCGGAYAVYAMLNGGGPRPADVLPSSTVAVVSVDLDPSAGQKISAISTIRKFPSLRKSLGLNSTDDLRKYIFDKLIASGSCSGLTFDHDLKSWIGNRAALAAVDLGGKYPAPALVLQVSDKVKATAGFQAIVKCSGASDLGYAVGKDYLIASDTTAHAQEILSEGEKKPLAGDAAYQKWTGEAGSAGVVNFYVAKRAVKYASTILDSLGASFGSGFSSGFNPGFNPGSSATGGASAPVRDGGTDPGSAIKDSLKNFEGLAGTIRFADGGMELSYATSSSGGNAARIGQQVEALPKDTAIAIGAAVPSGYAEKYFESFKKGLGSNSDDLISQAEDTTGLTFPGDIADLLGSGITVSLGGDAPADLNKVASPADLPFGVVLHTDASKARAVISKLEDRLGFQLSDIPVVLDGTSSKLVLSPSTAYASSLATTGSLGGNAAFRDAVPHADESGVIVYVNFDSTWRSSLIKLIKDLGGSESDVTSADDNTKPLHSLGFSSWVDGKVGHGLVRLTSD